jgi:hypothetical protein
MTEELLLDEGRKQTATIERDEGPSTAETR